MRSLPAQPAAARLNPKSETRSSKQIQKAEKGGIPKPLGWAWFRAFGLWIWGLFLISDSGFRVSGPLRPVVPARCDPAKQIVTGVMQTEVNEARGLDFAKAARHLLRQDPQVLVIGEIRDEETATIAVRAALTGHLVISTLHAGTCHGVFERLGALCADHSP